MSNTETTRVPRAFTISEFEDNERLFRRSRQLWTENRPAARDENKAQEREKATTNMELEREDILPWSCQCRCFRRGTGDFRKITRRASEE